MEVYLRCLYIRECASTLYVGLHVVPPTNTKSSCYFSQLKRVYRTQKSQAQNIIFKVYTHISGSIAKWCKYISAADKKPEILAISSHHVGLARAVPPTNTNFQLTFLLNRLQEALYEDLPV